MEPDLVLCDEVTSALDVSVPAAVPDLLTRLESERDTIFVFVSHELTVVRAVADRVTVLCQGQLCEIGPSRDIYRRPSHPYTEVLFGAVLESDPDFMPALVAEDVAELFPPPRAPLPTSLSAANQQDVRRGDAALEGGRVGPRDSLPLSSRGTRADTECRRLLNLPFAG